MVNRMIFQRKMYVPDSIMRKNTSVLYKFLPAVVEFKQDWQVYASASSDRLKGYVSICKTKFAVKLLIRLAVYT